MLPASYTYHYAVLSRSASYECDEWIWDDRWTNSSTMSSAYRLSPPLENGPLPHDVHAGVIAWASLFLFHLIGEISILALCRR